MNEEGEKMSNQYFFAVLWTEYMWHCLIGLAELILEKGISPDFIFLLNT